MSRLAIWFSPKLIALHVFAVAAIVFCVFMATWQLGLYDQRQADERAEKQSVPTKPLEEVWAPGEVFTGRQNLRPVTVTGQFRPADEQIWVTGKDGGPWLVAPVMVDGSALLVVRGQAEDVGEFPDVPSGQVVFDAVLQPTDGPADGFDPDTREIATVRIATLINELPYPLWSGYAVSISDSVSGGLDLAPRPEPEVSTLAGGRNLGYGLQWWVFATFAAFMWWRMARDAVADAR